MNPRLPIEWLEYLVTIGAKHDADGWRWKIDPVMRFGGFGPWRPEWSMYRLANVGVPLLGMHRRRFPNAWASAPSSATSRRTSRPAPDVEVFEDTGHFIHIEQPERVAALVTEFLA